jgi:hypothetical protein
MRGSFSPALRADRAVAEQQDRFGGFATLLVRTRSSAEAHHQDRMLRVALWWLLFLVSLSLNRTIFPVAGWLLLCQ